MKKTTKKEKFQKLLGLPEVQGDKELKEFIEHEIELLDKKHDKENPVDQAREALKQKIVDYLEELPDENPTTTITQMLKAPEFAEYTNQRISAMMRILGGEGKVARTEIKGVAYFSAN